MARKRSAQGAVCGCRLGRGSRWERGFGLEWAQERETPRIPGSRRPGAALTARGTDTRTHFSGGKTVPTDAHQEPSPSPAPTSSSSEGQGTAGPRRQGQAAGTRQLAEQGLRAAHRPPRPGSTTRRRSCSWGNEGARPPACAHGRGAGKGSHIHDRVHPHGAVLHTGWHPPSHPRWGKCWEGSEASWGGLHGCSLIAVRASNGAKGSCCSARAWQPGTDPFLRRPTESGPGPAMATCLAPAPSPEEAEEAGPSLRRLAASSQPPGGDACVTAEAFAGGQAAGSSVNNGGPKGPAWGDAMKKCECITCQDGTPYSRRPGKSPESGSDHVVLSNYHWKPVPQCKVRFETSLPPSFRSPLPLNAAQVNTHIHTHTHRHTHTDTHR